MGSLRKENPNRNTRTDMLFLYYFCLSCTRPDNGLINPLTPNDLYMGRTAPLTSKRYILYIYSTNVGTEYLKHALYSQFFFSSKCSLFRYANLFGSCIIHILYTGCAKIKKNNYDAKGLINPKMCPVSLSEKNMFRMPEYTAFLHLL